MRRSTSVTIVAALIALVACDAQTTAGDGGVDAASAAPDAAASGPLAGNWTHAGDAPIARNSRLTAGTVHDGWVYAAWTGLAPGAARVRSDGSGAVEQMPGTLARNIVAFGGDPATGELVALDAQTSDLVAYRLVAGAWVGEGEIGLDASGPVSTYASDTTMGVAAMRARSVAVVERDPADGSWSDLPGLGDGEEVHAVWDGVPLVIVVRPGRTDLATLRWEGASWSEAVPLLTIPVGVGFVDLFREPGGAIYLRHDDVLRRLDGGAWTELAAGMGTLMEPAAHGGSVYYARNSLIVECWHDGVTRRVSPSVSSGGVVDFEALGGSSIRLLSTPDALWLAWDEGSRGMRQVYLSRFAPE